jgi:hypothetical protein
MSDSQFAIILSPDASDVAQLLKPLIESYVTPEQQTLTAIRCHSVNMNGPYLEFTAATKDGDITAYLHHEHVLLIFNFPKHQPPGFLPAQK